MDRGACRRQPQRPVAAGNNAGPAVKARKRRKINPRRVKIHLSYTVHEVARCLGVDRCTVRRWCKAGLPYCDDRRPHLIAGQALRDFLQRRRVAKRHTCSPGQIFCVACREPVFPAEGKANYMPLTGTAGDLVGHCPRCGHAIHRRVNIAKLPLVRGDLKVALTKADSRLAETACPSSDAHFQARRAHASTGPRKNQEQLVLASGEDRAARSV
ncbi:MAG: helix-turn-helix domain-containing protein, partial [Terriglobia bacterium]